MTGFRTLHEVERETVLTTLYRMKGRMRPTADVLGVTLNTVKNKVRLYRTEGWIIPRPEQWDPEYLETKRREAEEMTDG